MRTVPAAMSAIWRSGDYTGSQRPFARVTVQPLWARYGGKASKLDNLYGTVAFHAGSLPPLELPNVKSVQIQRSTQNDVDTCKILLYNTAPMPLGAVPERDVFGYYTFLRGQGSFASRWDQTPNQFSRALLPDNIIRTYEGYGFDPSLIPEHDAHLVQSGLWLIDEVDYTATSGILTITCRDARRVLTEEVLRPPICRGPFYPLSFTSTQYGQTNAITGNGLAGQVLGDPKDLLLDSGEQLPPWLMVAIQGSKAPPILEPIVIHADGTVEKLTYHHEIPISYDSASAVVTNQGGSRPELIFPTHRGGLAHGSLPPFWMSEGHSRQVLRTSDTKPFLQGKLAPSYLTRLRVTTKHPSELIYVSVFADGHWVDQGKGSVDGLPYIGTFTQPNEGYQTYAPFVFNLTLPDPVENVTKVRLTFAALATEAQLFRAGSGWGFPGGANHWHAEVFSVEAFGDVARPGDIGPVPPSPAENPGYYNDYTEIVKLFCAWGVFWWPPDAGHFLTDGSYVQHSPSVRDTTLGYANNGRVYGDFEDTGTSGPAAMTSDVWLNQTLADGINYIKGIIGFVFLADELGGVIWRHANIYTPGNWRGPEDVGNEGSRPARTTDMIVIDELVTLVDLTVKIDSRNAREAIVVSSNDGRFAAGNAGYQLNPVNLRRVGGWPDNHFASDAECQMMADRIAIAQAMTARSYTVTIPGNPAIQLDDQVRVFERTASEGFIHYVNGIDSSNDLETGEWTYTLDTYWLGDQPDGNWGFDLRRLSNATLAYLGARNYIPPQLQQWGELGKKHAPQTWGAPIGRKRGR